MYEVNCCCITERGRGRHHCRVEQKRLFCDGACHDRFLKEKNTTLLIGTDDHKLDAVLAILKQEAGLRKTVTYAATPMESGNFCPGGNYSVPIDTQTGGCTVFVLNMEQLEKF